MAKLIALADEDDEAFEEDDDGDDDDDDDKLKVHWKGRVRGREEMSTRGKREERGEGQINECLFR